MDSVLEARFIEALRRVTKDGTQATVTTAVVENKPGFRFALDDSEWIIIPQVNFGANDGFGVGVSIDFVLKPVGKTKRQNPERLPIAIFLDGWAYHKDRVGHDLVQRMALIASGRFDVWSLTWRDLDEKLTNQDVESVTEFAIGDPGKLRFFLQRDKLAQYCSLADRSVFELLEMELLTAGLPWNKLAQHVAATRG